MGGQPETHTPHCDGVDVLPWGSVARADILLCVSQRTLRSVRRASVLFAFAATSLLAASPAGADVPEGWSDPDPVPPLEALLVLAGIPVLLIVAITAAVYVPALVRGERVVPGAAARETPVVRRTARGDPPAGVR